MSRTSRNPILLLALLFAVVLGLGNHAYALPTATISVGGAEQQFSGNWDANTITVSLNGFVETVRYGQFSTPASVASAFGAMFSRDYLQAGLCAHATGNVITFQLRGAATFGTVDVTGSTASFQLTPSGFYAAVSKTADTGTVTLTVNNAVIATTNYGAGATPSSIAADLAAAMPATAPVKATAVNDALYLVAATPGAASNYAYSIQNAGWDYQDFSQPSFPASVISGNLDGGANASSPGQSTPVYNFAGSYDGVGNLTVFTDSVMGAWSFSYDSLNRLSAAAAATNAPAPYAGNYGCWSYDAFGNRLAQAVSTTPCANNPPLTSWANYNANNQFTNTSQAPGGVAYDAAGNVTNDGVNQYLYDGEGRICAVQSTPVPGFTTMTGYLYDADGVRVAKGSITSMSCDPAANGFQTTSDYVHGPSGEQVTEMAMDANGSMAWQHTNVWAAGKLLATYDPDGLHFYLNDPLGTRRVQTDYAGVLEQTCASLPFGDALACTGSPQYPTEHHFTGKERDAESGNDYFGARYYASSMGRWMSPDWSEDPDPIPYADPNNPQTLNLYEYIENNPLRSVDPDGHMHQECTKTQSSTQDADGTIHITVSEHCTSIPDFWDWAYWKPRPPTNAEIQAWKVASSKPDYWDHVPVQVGIIPWGMTGGLSAGSLIRIIEQEPGAIHLAIQTAKGEVEVMASVSKEGDKLVLSNVHVSGEGLGPGLTKQAARELGAQEGVSEVVVQGGERTGGAVPGHTPASFTVRVK
jgi:RHS repeat-associated protein